MRQRQKRFRDEKRKIRTPCPQHHQDPVFQCKKEKKGDERHKCLEKNCRQKEGRSRKDEDLME